jgi:amino acid transporter
MVGWTLLVGYVGSLGMYAYAFGEFAVALPIVPESAAGVPHPPGVSVLAVAGFVDLNLLGARATGSAENVLVAGKVAVLVAFGAGGVGCALVASPEPVALGLGGLASVEPVVAAAISFVAFQGWQLLFYDQESVGDAETTVPRAIAIAVPAAVVIYVVVAIATYNLAPQALQQRPHTALARAAATVLGAVGLSGASSVIISVSALFSTGSAINATLFSAGYFAKGMLPNDLLPDRVGDSSASGVPTRTLLALGALTAAFTAYGSLSAITSFASLSFIAVFGGVSRLAFARRDAAAVAVRGAVPAVGAVGSIGFPLVMSYRLYTAETGTFYAVVGLAAALHGVDILYFERETLERELPVLDG